MEIVIGGRYKFDNQTDIIGRGGMGTVYRGKDTTTNTVIAIKQLRPDLTDTEIIARFIREADILRQLKHPHIIRVVDRISDVELGHYIVMEHITNGSLWDELQATRPLSIGRSITLAQNLASALMLVHEKNIIHRDIKPANVLIADDKLPRLCDFGVVYIKDNNAIAEADVLVGTLDYLAPEIISGDPITPQADIWSFGVMLYEMVGGKKPFTSDNPSTIIANILIQPHHQLAQLRADAPSGLVKLIEWMLVKDPVKRAPNMSIIHQTLTDISNEGAFNTTISYTHPVSLGKKPFKRIGTSPKIFTDNLFYDRNHEQTNLTNALVDGKSFIGVYGRGGIGKTALVSKVLGDIEKRGEANGIAYIRANSSPSLNIISILDTLGEFLPSDHHFNTLRRDVNTTIADKTHALINGLADGRYIVYIDNLETLQHPENYTLLDEDIRQLFETLVESTSGVLTVIITSRYPIPFPNTLKVHETIIRLDEGLPEADAILFLRDMDRLGVLPTEDDLLTHWVDKVGGYPRGLEALVGYLNGGETRHIDDLLQDEALFEGEVLSNIVHHAHNALPQDFRNVMAAVAVIDNATTRSELEYLLSPYLDAGRLRFILERLVDGRFLSYNRQNRTYSLHPIDHAYALSSTPEGSADDAETAFTRHILNKRMADYYRARRTPKETWKSLADIEPLLREMTHSFNAGDYDRTAEIFIEIDFTHLIAWGYIELLVIWHSRLEDKIPNPKLAQRSVGNLGTAYSIMGDSESAIIKYEKAIRMAREQGNKQAENGPLGNLGLTYANMGKLELAIEYYQQALVIDKEIDYKRGQGIRLGNLGNAYSHMGQLDTAIDYFQQALDLAKEAGDRTGEARHLDNLGNTLTTKGQPAEALPHLLSALEIAKDINSARDMNFTLAFLARTYWFLGDNANALTTIKQAREYDAGFINHAVALWHGCIAWCNGLTDEARNAFYDALSYANEVIEKFPTQYDAIYIRALACAGLWIITGDISYHADAIKAYTDAKAISAYAGILLYNRQNLEAVLRYSDKDGSALIAILQ